MSKSRNKMQFEVLENETIDQCLERIKKQGYVPIRRIEKPIFQEVNGDEGLKYEPIRQQIIFEAIKHEQ